MTARPIADLVREQREGAFHDEASTALHKLIMACTTLNKPGSLTLTLSVKPQIKLGKNVIEISDDVKVNEPRADRQSSIFFTTKDGNYSRKNPDQMEMQLKAVRVDDPEGPRAAFAE